MSSSGPHATGGERTAGSRSSDDRKRAFRLSGELPRVTRLSRKVLAGGSAFVLLLIAGAAFWALQRVHPQGQPSGELHGTDHHNVADGLTNLPRDYSAVSRDVAPLAQPLPGDSGRPAVAAKPLPVVIDPEQQRANQDAEAARTSKLFASTNLGPTASNQVSKTEQPADRGGTADEAFAQNGQDRKLAFVNASVDRHTSSAERIAPPASPFVVQAGTAIPAALITGIRSDLPGQITAQVTENVYDSPTGRATLIPQGARLIGLYDSQIAFGQSRVQLVWTRLIMPNGHSIVLERQQGTDGAGYSGLEDEVDNHWGELFKAAVLSTVLGVGAELGAGADSGNNASILQALRLGATNALNQTGQQVVRRDLNVQPTLTIRPGFPVRVIVNRDLVLEPYRS